MIRFGLSSSLSLALVLGALSFAGLSLGASSEAKADSCWWHNGSLMRLKARGNDRWFYYERPRADWRSAKARFSLTVARAAIGIPAHHEPFRAIARASQTPIAWKGLLPAAKPRLS